MQPWGALEVSDHVADHWIVCGVPKSGKTTLARALARSARRAVFFDPPCEFTDEGLVISADELLTYPELFRGTWIRLVVQPAGGDVDVADEFVTTVNACRAAKEEGGLLFVSDEVGDFARRGDLSAVVRTLVALHRNGHKDGIASICTSQRAQDIPLGARATANRVLSLLQDHKDDLDALAEVYGREYADRVAAWKPGDPPVEWARVPLRFPHRKGA